MSGKGMSGIFVCGGENCRQRGNDKIAREIAVRIEAEGLGEQVSIGRMFCFRMCAKGPNIMVMPDGDIHNGVTIKKLDAILPALFKKTREAE